MGPGLPRFRSRFPALLGPPFPPGCRVLWGSGTSTRLVSGETESVRPGLMFAPPTPGAPLQPGLPGRLPPIPAIFHPASAIWCPNRLRGRRALPRSQPRGAPCAPEVHPYPWRPRHFGKRRRRLAPEGGSGAQRRPTPFPVRASIPRPRPEALGKGLGEEKRGKARRQ